MTKSSKIQLNTIRTKLILNFILISIIPVMIIGTIFWFQTKGMLYSKLKVTSKQTLTQVNLGLDNYFNGKSNVVEAMADDNSFASVNNKDSIKDVKELLKSEKESDSDIINAYIGTETGEFFIYPNTKMPDDFNPTERPWYKDAIAHSDKVIITLPYKDAATGKMILSLAKAVQKNGEITGVTAMDVSIDTVIKNISKNKIGSTGYLFIADVNGNIIAHPEKSLIGTDTAAKLSFWDKAKNNSNGFAEYNYKGTKKFGVYETNEVTGWKLVAALNNSELSKDTNKILYLVLSIIAVILAISILLAMLASRSIALNIKNLKEVFSKASHGDFTASIKSRTNDEFSDLANDFNMMIGNISLLMKNVKGSSKTVFETAYNLATMSEQTSDSINEVSRAIQEVAAGASGQAESIQESTLKMGELSVAIDSIIKSNDEMDNLSSSTQNLSSQGLNIVKVLTEKSDKTKLSTQKVFEIVSDMDRSTDKISSISDTINAITAQTNLLSLNASIEAARAGEAGKGFQVVAGEIRGLAEQSKKSTGEIKAIIEDIKCKSETAVRAIEETGNIVIEQETVVKETQEIFSEIIKLISLVINGVNQIKVSAENVNSKKESVKNQLETIAEISEQTASASEEVTASAEEINATMEELTSHATQLESLSETLQKEIDKFKLK